MAKYRASDDNLILDFSSRMDERRRRLRTALKQIPGADLKDWSMLLLVCHFSDGDGLVRDYDELSELLWCGRRTVIRLVKRLEELDLLEVRQTYDRDGAASKNAYKLNWDRIDALVTKSIRSSGATVRQCQDDTGGCQDDTGQCQIDTTQCQDGTSFKEELFPGTLSGNSLNTVPVRKAGPVPLLEVSQKPRASRDWLCDAGLSHIPELVEALDRRVTPLPVGALAEKGTYYALEASKLISPPYVIDWFQRQLSLASPVCGPSEAELMLCLATAAHVYHTPSDKITKSRPAYFSYLIANRKWLKVAYRIGKARTILESIEREKGAYWRT